MRLTIGQEFDGGAWPPLAGAASAGAAVEGPHGLLKRVETALGLAAAELSPAERLAALVPVFDAVQGYFSASARTDPFATARRLLQERDELVLAGWELQPVSERLGQLATLSREMKPGVPDRLRAAIDALGRRGTPLERVDLVEEEHTWPLLWRRLFAALRARGTRVEHVPPTASAPSGDLLRVRGAEFLPEGDGSLLLLRGAGPLETADEVAAWLASLDRGTTVVVTPDAVLDAALARHGLPTTGAPGRTLDSAAMQVLPLVLELLWDPPDPAAVHELLGLPRSPIPKDLRWRLRKALETWPAVRSPEWESAYGEWLAQLPESEPDERRRERQRERAALLLQPAAAGEQREVALAVVLDRIDALAAWMNVLRTLPKHASRDDDDEAPDTGELDDAWDCAFGQVRRLRSFLLLGGLKTVERVRLRKLVELASEGLAAPGRCDAQAGIHAVGAPGAVTAPADTVVWWDFDRDHSPPVRALLLTKAEREALGAAGVELPSAGARAVEAARSWRRPLLSATQRLVLCCPRRSEAGETRAPHALWDELEASIPNADRQRPGRVARLVRQLAPVDRTPRALRATPQPRRDWNVGRALLPRPAESPSSLETLVGCSFKWAVQHAAALPEHPTRALQLDTRVLGSLVHHVLEHVLRDLPPTAAEARTKAARLFAEQGPRLVAQLFQPGRELQRTETSRVVAAAAEGLARFIHGTGRTVAAVEQELSRDVGGWTIKGRMDLRLGGPTAIVDLKYGGRAGKREALKHGTATQLASYAYLVSEGTAPLPPVAYFIVSEQTMHSAEAARLGEGVQAVTGPTPEETWEGFRTAIDRRWTELKAGTLAAHATDGGRSTSRLADGDLTLDAPCHYCQYDAICGRALGEGT